ncbi:MAG: DUF4434 domain-containing protein [Candidatus Sumerlaeia bacterium]|nr:DUF4434 domain-containing protein [Candidatus Sumerlaeia bacterium]
MITGTFLDEISHDIPDANWGRDEWTRDFRAMADTGIDTVILIRAGYRDIATFDSKVLRREHPHLIVADDQVGMFLDLAERHGMTFYFGTYDSGRYWHSGQHDREADLNIAFTEEFISRYGHCKAFGGWYISHEINSFDEGVMKVYERLAGHLKSLRDLPILISPYIRGVKQFGAEQAIGLSEHEREWREVFARIRGHVDIVAFQDGHVDYAVLPDYLAVNAALAREHGIACWSNIESFDRDMPIKFPPIGWRKMRYKMQAAMRAGVDKLITFEFSHFMSPNSIYPAAHTLHRRYMEFKRAADTAV